MTIEFGNERIISVSRQPLKGGGWVSLHEDVTLRRRQEQEISHLARHDVLTNLANRALFREQLQAALLRLREGRVSPSSVSTSTASRPSTTRSGTPSATCS